MHYCIRFVAVLSIFLLLPNCFYAMEQETKKALVAFAAHTSQEDTFNMMLKKEFIQTCNEQWTPLEYLTRLDNPPVIYGDGITFELKKIPKTYGRLRFYIRATMVDSASYDEYEARSNILKKFKELLGTGRSAQLDEVRSTFKYIAVYYPQDDSYAIEKEMQFFVFLD